MSDDITPERIEKLKRQVPPGTPPEAWKFVISQELWPDKYCSSGSASVNNHVLRCLIADADAREAAEPKEPPIPPCPEGAFEEEWRELFGALRGILNDTHLVAAIRTYKLADHILAALESFRPGVEMVPIEAYVRSERDKAGFVWWLARLPHTEMLSRYATKNKALAAVREGVRRVMAEREPADG